jgi:hypothetical protein
MENRIEAWGAATAIALLAICALARFLLPGVPAGNASPGFQLVTYANTALAASAAMYAAHLWLRTDLVGRAATALAGIGALGVLAGLVLGTLQAGSGRAGLYEGIALFSALVVLAYLGLERSYRSRSAGILVMPAVMLAILCEMWLILQGLAAPGRPPDGLAGYWESGHRFAMSLGYCPLAAAGCLAALAITARNGDASAAVARLSAMVSVGAPLLLLGATMGAVWAVVDGPASSRAAGFVVVAVLTAAVALLASVRMRRQDAMRGARLALGVFLVSTAGLFAAGWISEALV